MIGPILNAAGILIGGSLGLMKPKPLAPAQEGFLRVGLAVLTVFYGLRLVWFSFSGSFGHILKQVLILVLAMMIGRLIGRLLRLQKMSNHLGQRARGSLAAVRPSDPARASEGFRTCAALFCAAPLGIVGAVEDGLSAYWYPLAVKAFIDGLAAMGFVAVYGWGVLLSALPVLACFGTLSLTCAHLARPFLEAYELWASVNAVSGMLIFSVALIMLGLKKVELTDYLPSLAVAPLLAALLA